MITVNTNLLQAVNCSQSVSVPFPPPLRTASAGTCFLPPHPSPSYACACVLAPRDAKVGHALDPLVPWLLLVVRVRPRPPARTRAVNLTLEAPLRKQ